MGEGFRTNCGSRAAVTVNVTLTAIEGTPGEEMVSVAVYVLGSRPAGLMATSNGRGEVPWSNAGFSQEALPALTVNGRCVPLVEEMVRVWEGGAGSPC